MNESLLLRPAAPGVWELVLNRPGCHNAFDDTLIAAMIQQLDNAAHLPDLRLLVLRSTGRHFSAGADLAWMQRAAGYSRRQNLADAEQLALLLRRLDQFPGPTLALVQGAAYGGALGLVACCDLVVAADDARFCLSEVRLGLIPATIAPYVLRALGPRQARRYMLTAELIPAREAERLGLVHLLAEPGQSPDEAAAPDPGAAAQWPGGAGRRQAADPGIRLPPHQRAADRRQRPPHRRVAGRRRGARGHQRLPAKTAAGLGG